MSWYNAIIKIKPDGKAFRSILFSKIFYEVIANGLSIIKDYAVFTINDQVWYVNDNFNPEPWERRYEIDVPYGQTLEERREVVKNYMLFPLSENRLSLDYMQLQLDNAGFSDMTIYRNPLGTAYTKVHGNNITDTEGYTVGSEPYNTILISGNLTNDYYESMLLLLMSIKPLDTAVYDTVTSLLALAVNDGVNDFALAVGEALEYAHGSLGTGQCEFYMPMGIITTSTNIFIADRKNGRIQVFDLSCNYEYEIFTIVALAVNDGISDVALAVNDGVDDFALAVNGMIDATGIAANDTHIFISDTDNNQVQKFELLGTHVLNFGTFGTGNGEFDNITGIAINSTNIFVCDTGNNRIQVFDLLGVYVSQFGILGTANGEFDNPIDIKINDTHIFVTDQGNNRVQKFDLLYNFVLEIGVSNGLSNPVGIGIYENTLYVCDSGNGRVLIYDLEGNYHRSFNTTILGEIPNVINYIAINEDYIFITDANNKVKKYSKPLTLSLNQI